MAQGCILHVSGSFCRTINEEDIVTPEMGRVVANEIGASYYETSVLVSYGIDDLFTNVLRSSLTSKRDRHFWNMLGNLKRINKPVCQAPLLPPRPSPPHVQVPPVDEDHNLETLLNNQAFCDVIFVAQGVCIQAHKVCLLAAAPVFEDLFLSSVSSPVDPVAPTCKLQRANSRASSSSQKRRQSDTVNLLEDDETDTSSIGDGSSEAEVVAAIRCQPEHLLNHPAFHSVQVQQCEDMFSPGCTVMQTVVTMHQAITPAALQVILQALYTGKFLIDKDCLQEVHTAAELLGLKQMLRYITNVNNNEAFLNSEVEAEFLAERAARIKDLLIKRGLLAGESWILVVWNNFCP